jgi:hypothetical protein
MRSKGYLKAAVAVVFTVLAGAASAGPALTLVGPISGNTVGPQSASNPCIIAATNCQQPSGFGYNNFTSNGSTSSYNMYSTTPTATVADGVQGTPYTVGQLAGVIGNKFDVAIDINTAAGLESLLTFEVIVNGSVWQTYSGPTLVGNALNNGNGYADFYLTRVDLSSFADNATVLFHASWNNASDGGESFFLVNGENRRPPQEALFLFVPKAHRGGCGGTWRLARVLERFSPLQSAYVRCKNPVPASCVFGSAPLRVHICTDATHRRSRRLKRRITRPRLGEGPRRGPRARPERGHEETEAWRMIS